MKRFLVIAILIIIFGAIFVNLAKPEILPSISDKIITNNNQDKKITIVTTGDIGLVRDINYQIQQKKNPNYPFLEINEYLSDADLTISNLEGPLIKNCPISREGFTFCGDLENVKGLVYSGIDAVSLANNHTTNFGADGLKQTIDILKENNIVPYGYDNKIQYLDIKATRIALIGFVELGNNWGGLNNATEENVTKLISEARNNSDLVIVSFHWGNEYTHIPTQNQIDLAHLAVDSGADLVLGNHAHWIQINEIYKNKFITYAQGNTVFDQDWSQETKEGVLYKFEYVDGNLRKVDERFTIIEENIKPRFATEEEVNRIKNKLN